VDWLVPALLGMNLMGTGLWGIGFAVAEQRQKKLLRRFLVTPMKRSSYLLSFVISRLVFLVIELGVLLTFGLLILGVPLIGSVFAFTVLCLLGSLAFAGVGLLVASRPKTIEGISGVLNLVMMPMWLCSGVFFSYERFPAPVQVFCKALPLTALNDALRLVMLDGKSLGSLFAELAVLLLWGVLSFLVALKIFRWE
jgi:ABC-type multidrug transport system permease subunit